MTKQSNNEAAFTSGSLSVTKDMLRFRGRRYKLRHIENLILKRSLFLTGSTIGLFLVGLAIFNWDILYAHEVLISSLLAVIIPALCWPVGTLTIQSRTLSVDGGTITWLHRDLAKAQEVIEEAQD